MATTPIAKPVAQPMTLKAPRKSLSLRLANRTLRNAQKLAGQPLRKAR